MEIPPKHVQSLPMRALIATSADDRFLLVQNATPSRPTTLDVPVSHIHTLIALESWLTHWMGPLSTRHHTV